ncbi:MAG: xanthine dehydrogenase accessory protein XdhC [Myxococcales bacterium]|nr:xanthine dehydrogenase accessory protein XdhC [Myxococcales bacterium]
MTDTRLWQALIDAATRGESVALTTVVAVNGSAPRGSGARMVVWPDGSSLGTVGGGQFEQKVIEAALAAMAAGAPRRYSVHLTRDLGMCCGGAMDVFIEPLRPVDRLLLFGAGHVARPTALFAREAGWAVTVIDDRDELLTEARFPGCDRVGREPRAFARTLDGDPRGWVFLVTHDHQLDQDLLEVLLAKQWAWIGLIGSRTKVAKFRLRLRAAGVSEAQIARVSGPVGLDIGAETPEEIAIAVLAEMVRTRRGVTRPPGLLRLP